MDTILNLIPGRRAAASNEPSEEAIRRTHDNLRWVSKALHMHTLVLFCHGMEFYIVRLADFSNTLVLFAMTCK